MIINKIKFELKVNDCEKIKESFSYILGRLLIGNLRLKKREKNNR